jgi:hypothetical protein
VGKRVALCREVGHKWEIKKFILFSNFICDQSVYTIITQWPDKKNQRRKYSSLDEMESVYQVRIIQRNNDKREN